jgi:hypothetical protein
MRRIRTPRPRSKREHPWLERDERTPIGRNAIARTARALLRCEMPPEEISAVLGADNPELVRRYMELHRERLGEGLADRLRTLAGLERFLVQAMIAPREGTAATRTVFHESGRGGDHAGHRLGGW